MTVSAPWTPGGGAAGGIAAVDVVAAASAGLVATDGSASDRDYG